MEFSGGDEPQQRQTMTKCIKVLASTRASHDCGEAEAGIAVVEKSNPRMDMNVFRSLSQASLQKA